MAPPVGNAAAPASAVDPAGAARAEAAAVVAFWQDLGLPGLVDIHTHFMPSNVPGTTSREGGHETGAAVASP